jgi:hypothetical protein
MDASQAAMMISLSQNAVAGNQEAQRQAGSAEEQAAPPSGYGVASPASAMGFLKDR